MRSLALCVLLGLTAAVGLSPQGAVADDKSKALSPEERELLDKLQSLREEINLLNLYNGLYLTDDQVAKILAYAREAQKIRQHAIESAKGKIQDAVAAFEELKGVLEKNEGIPPAVEQKAGGVDMKQITMVEEIDKKLDMLAGKVAEILTEEQVEVLRDFKPCVIPPKNLKDPVRVGQASDNRRAEALLREFKKMPDKLYGQRKAQIVERLLEKGMKHAPLTDEEVAAERKRLGDVLDRVRKMSEVDIELNKEELAKELKLRSREKEIRDELHKLTFDKEEGTNEIRRYFLSAHAVSILQKRLGLIAGFEKEEPADLDDLKDADEGAPGG